MGLKLYPITANLKILIIGMDSPSMSLSRPQTILTFNALQLNNYLYTYVELYKQLMCTDICPCSPSYNKTAYASYQFTGKNFTGTNLNLTGCLQAQDYSYKWDYDLINYMSELERTYSCSGLCNSQTLLIRNLFIYQLLFTDFTSGPNFRSCQSHISKDLERDMGNMGYVFLTCGTFVFCAWFCSFGLCFRDKDAKALREQIRLRKYVLEPPEDENEQEEEEEADGPQRTGKKGKRKSKHNSQRNDEERKEGSKIDPEAKYLNSAKSQGQKYSPVNKHQTTENLQHATLNTQGKDYFKCVFNFPEVGQDYSEKKQLVEGKVQSKHDLYQDPQDLHKGHYSSESKTNSQNHPPSNKKAKTSR